MRNEERRGEGRENKDMGKRGVKIKKGKDKKKKTTKNVKKWGKRRYKEEWLIVN